MTQVPGRLLIWLTATLVVIGALAVAVPAQADSNLIPNPSVEVAGASPSSPISWQTGHLWGDADVNYQYLNTGYQSNHSVKVAISRYVSGDAKWYFTPVSILPSQAYKFTDTYKSTIVTHVVVAVTNVDSTTSYLSLNDAPASSSWKSYTATFTAPATAASLTVYHLINAVGTVTTDNFSLTAVSSTFNRGLVSLTFDDGWQSQFTNGQPLLNQYGDKATYYIITGLVGDTADGYMTLSQVKDLSLSGHEIGSHTVHHYDLTTLSLAQLNAELSQSLAYLQNKLGKSITSFSYPYGAYNAQTDQRVKKYYQSARSSDEGLNSKTNFNAYNIRSEHITPQTTIAQVQAWIDEAKNQREWLVLMYHQVDTSGSDYSVTPAMLTAQLQTVQASGLAVKTVSQALTELKPQL